ncbi:MAG: hypothetical protein WC548_02435 [Candidatus Pacearchaeota archaeon]
MLREIGAKRERNISFLIAVLAIGLLLVAGPAQAFNVSLDPFNNSNPSRGDIVNTTAKIKINSNDDVYLGNPAYVSMNGIVVCTFDLKGSNKNCIDGVSIELIGSNSSLGYDYSYGYDYGYNYGYGYYFGGEFNYKITINTSEFLANEYEIRFGLQNEDDYDSQILKINSLNNTNFGVTSVKSNMSSTGRFKPRSILNNSDSLNESIINLGDNEGTGAPGFLSSITGAVIGTLGTGGSMAILVLVLALILGIVFVGYRRLKLKK